ncbi:MAG: MFS transporter [Proteobacteria bacterium]|uniref:MFS transporter n=1 Tax=Rudaea sp. TaxID=2136325 RepID=UPI001DA1E9C5|nr:MFS transporter [Pseudomonadota bacterium]MBS0567169.1 MFS transporter [Pseudomonadota bacterium]
MSDHSQFRLLRERRFLPFFLTQALGAFNDNVFRVATILLIGFSMSLPDEKVAFYNNIAPALFILPFFLFSASAGQLAEKFEKTRIIRFVKLFEIAAMAIATWGFVTRSPWLLLFVLFLMGAHSTLFGPIKYAILPQALDESELVGGNALVETATQLAILFGMMVGGALMATGGANGPLLASIAVLCVAAAGYLVCRAIPPAPPTAPGLRFNWNILSETWRVMRFAARDRTVFNSVLGISWFWFFGIVVTAQLPSYTKIFLGGNDAVFTFTLALFSIGTGIGSLLCERLSGHKVEIGLVPFGSIGITLFGVDLYFARPHPAPVQGLGPLEFLHSAGGWHIAFDLTLIGVFAGFYIVPLFALVQSRAERDQLSRIIAGNNIINALFMVAATALSLALLNAAHFTIPQLFLVAALLNAAVAIYIYTLVPEFLLRFVDWILISLLYRVRTEGLDNIPEEGPAVLVCNHVSFMDAQIVLGCIRRPVRFVMYYKIFNTPLRPLFKAMKAIPIAGAKENPELLQRAFAEVDKELALGNLVCIFPEGGITRDGDIAPFRPGIERILATQPVPVVPMALRGLWGSIFSRKDSWLNRARLPRRFRARIELVAGPAVPAAQATAAMLEAKVRALRGNSA